MNDGIKETNYMLSYIAAKIDDTIVDDYIGKINDYITNLQQENERLKENAEHNDKVVDKAKWNEMIYKSRIEKAVKKLEEYDRQYIVVHDVWSDCFILKVINILNGRSDE